MLLSKSAQLFLVSRYNSSHPIYTNQTFHYVIAKMTVAWFVITLTSRWFSLSNHCEGIPNLLKCWLQTACSCIVDILNLPGTIKSTYAKWNMLNSCIAHFIFLNLMSYLLLITHYLSRITHYCKKNIHCTNKLLYNNILKLVNNVRFEKIIELVAELPAMLQ